mgnify:CR=1 FL=1
MNYRIRITEAAKQDLREIAVYIAEEAKDAGIAKRFVNELREECKRLEVFPNAGALPKDRILLSSGYRYLVYKDYLIFYTVYEMQKEVDVLAIFHAKKDYMRIMRKFI